MKICMLTTSYPRWKGDPSSPFIEGLCKELVKKGIEVNVVAPHDFKTKDHEIITNVKIHRFQYWLTKKGQKLAYHGGMPYNLTHFTLSKIQLPIFMLFFILKGLSVSKKCDIIHAHFLPSGCIGGLIKIFSKKVLLTTVHGSDIHLIPKIWPISKLYFKTISLSDCFLSNSNANKKNLIKLGFQNQKISVVPNGIDITLYKKTSVKNIDKSYPRIIWVGRMVKVKGLEYLIDAMKIIVKDYPSSKLILIGDGPLKPQLEKLSIELSLDKNIIFRGFIKNEDIPKHLRNADIFVLPSVDEGFGVVALEAMGAGKPIVASNVGGIPDIIKDGVNGMLVKAKDPKKLAEKIIYLIEKPELREKMGKNGREMVDKMFTWDLVAERIIKIYYSFLAIK